METEILNKDLEFGRQLRRPTGEYGIEVGQIMNQSNKVFYDDVFNLLPQTPAGKLLEIGFGNGIFFKNYLSKQPNLALTGLDFSETMLSEATKNNKDLLENGSLKLHLGDSLKMPFPDNNFDHVVAINTLYFWPSVQEQLNEIKRVLKKGGDLFLGYRPKDSVKDAPFTKEVFTLYHPEEVKDMVKEAGFLLQQQTENYISLTTDKGKEIQMPGFVLHAVKP